MIYSQNQIDTIQPVLENTQNFTKLLETKKQKKYTNEDLKKIDSLLLSLHYNTKIDSTKYVIADDKLISNVEYTVPTEVLKSRLEYLNEKTPFNMEYNPTLEKVINNYVKYRRKYFPALMARAKYYFPIFEQYLLAYDIPIEMKYLAIVESALKPRIKSRVGATGLWQFMYGTAKLFKLDMNSYVDERQDPIKSTITACKFLKMLYEKFNDWDLALAAYNSGPGNVLKAIKRSGGMKNYWNLRPFLPRETAGYVPAFYATMYVFEYADELHIKSPKPEFYNFETDTVALKYRVSFQNISEKTGVSKEVLELLNPQYKINIIPKSSKKQFSVRLPRNKIFDFLEKEQEIYSLAYYDDSQREKPLPKYVSVSNYNRTGNRTRYRVKSGDFLGKIAKRFGVRVKQLKRWNNLRSNKLKIGQKLYIYR